MPKYCEYKFCSKNAFGGGFCTNHQYLRTDKKPKPLKRTPIKKTSAKRATVLGERKAATLKDREFFLEIWNEREHVDFETCEPIYGEPLTLYFHHVLAKRPGEYPQYRYEKWNIIIVSWNTHTLAEGNQWKKIPKIAAYRDELLKKYT